MPVKLRNTVCRLLSEPTGLKNLFTSAGENCLSWTTISEYVLQIQIGDTECILDSREATVTESVDDEQWVRQFAHTAATVEVRYFLQDTTAIKQITVIAKMPLTLRYAQVEVALSHNSLTRGGEGQPLFAGERGFISSTFPAAENQADGRKFVLRQAPYVELNHKETFDLAPVVFGLNTTGDMAESFWKYLCPCRPHPKESMSVYCDWGAHDETAADSPSILNEELANRLLDNLQKAKRLYDVSFDYYVMDDFWYTPTAPYTTFNAANWPQGPDMFIQSVREEGMKFGLWFDVNMQKVGCGGYAVRRGDSPDRLCMSYYENMQNFFKAVKHHVKEHHVRLLKFDFAYFDCNDKTHKFHSQRPVASKEPAIRYFIEEVNALRREYPDFRILAYNGFTTDLSFIGSVDPNRRGIAVSPFWAQTVDYVYCGDPRPAEQAAPLHKSLLHYTDCMIEQFQDALFPLEAIDDHGTMVGKTNTIYYLGTRSLRDSYILNLARGTRKKHLYGEVGMLTDEDWKTLSKAETMFEFVSDPDCHTTPILQRPSENRVYGYSNTTGNRGYITVVNTTAIPQDITAVLPCWSDTTRLVWKRCYHNGEWAVQDLPNMKGFSLQVDPFAVDVYEWERTDVPHAEGYVYVDAAQKVTLSISANYRKIGLRFMKDNGSPIRMPNCHRDDIQITAENATLSLCDDVPVWSGISYSLYDIHTAHDIVTLCLVNNTEMPITVHWQNIGTDR